MRTRFSLMASAALAIAAAASAEPAKPEARPAGQPSDKPAQVVLASAEQAPAPAPALADQPATPVKRRAARVTTCRCANQNEPNER